jgi:hypothetical protein
MFGLFKKTSKEDKLYKKYEKLLAESHRLSTSSRLESEKKFVEAQEILKEIDSLSK